MDHIFRRVSLSEGLQVHPYRHFSGDVLSPDRTGVAPLSVRRFDYPDHPVEACAHNVSNRSPRLTVGRVPQPALANLSS